MERRYFHGTRLQVAVTALMQGEALKTMRPSGSSRFSRSAAGEVYLTPSFNQAREYAWMTDRADWPDVNRSAFTEPRIFEFSVDTQTPVRPEEDELGFAVKVSFCRKLGQSHHWNMNDEFAERIVNDENLRNSLVEVVMTGLGHGKWSEIPTRLTGADCAKVGRRLLRILPTDLTTALVDAGISIATKVALRPSAVYFIEAGVSRPENARRQPITQTIVEEEYETALKM